MVFNVAKNEVMFNFAQKKMMLSSIPKELRLPFIHQLLRSSSNSFNVTWSTLNENFSKINFPSWVDVGGCVWVAGLTENTAGTWLCLAILSYIILKLE